MIKKHVKSGITFLLATIMILFCFIPTVALAEEQNVREEEAKYLAIAFLWDVQSCSEAFDGEIYCSDIFTLYDSNLNPSAYVVNFVDKNDLPNGYVVVDATSDNPEILEFSDRGKSPYEEQYVEVESQSNEKI